MFSKPQSKYLLLSSILWLLASCSGGTSFNIGGPDDDTDGQYDVFFDLSEASAGGTECQELTGSFELNGSALVGSVLPNYLTTGTLSANNSITGVILFESGDKLADYSGQLSFDQFNGTWADITGCTGSWAAYPS